MNIEMSREQFPILVKKTYLNSCSYGAMAGSVRQAMESYLDDRDSEGACWEHWVGNLEELRAATAELLGADASEIALVASLSSGLNALASCLDFSASRNKVVVTSNDFPTTAHIWHAQKRRGAVLSRVELDACPTPEQALQSFHNVIDQSTLIVSIPYVCYRNGRKLDVEAITQIAHENGALAVVDAYQAVGTFPIDALELNVDVLLGGYLKYLLGTAGLAYMYVKGDLVETLLPTATGWFAQEDVAAMTVADNLPARSARRFEGGTPNVAGINTCRAGLDIIKYLGIPGITHQVNSITSMIKHGIRERGWDLATGDWPHGAMIALGSLDMVQLVENLAAEGIVVSCRDDNIRISPHFYNNKEDIDKLFNELDKNRSLVKSRKE